MSLLDPGQAKTDPVNGISGDMWTDLSTDTDSSVFANITALSPCPGTLTADQIAHRKNLAVMLEAIAKAFGVVFSVGTGTINHATNSVTISDSKITVNSYVFPSINQSPDATLTSIAGWVATAGSVTIYGNANANGAFGVNVVYLAVNA